jgi:beta-lactamase class A
MTPQLRLTRVLLDEFGMNGRVGLYVSDSRSGEVLAEANAFEPFDSASMIKLALLAVLVEECRAGRFSLDRPMDVLEGDRAAGDGILREWALPLALSIADVVTAMVVLSDNTATNAILRILGVERVNDQLAAWGFDVTRSLGSVAAPDERRTSIGVTCAREVARLLRGLIIEGFGSAGHRVWCQRVLEHQQDERAMRRYLAHEARCAHKTGTVGAFRHDGGLIIGEDGLPLVTAVFLTEGLGPAVERPDHPGVLAIARATVRVIRDLSLPVPLVPWAPAWASDKGRPLQDARLETGGSSPLVGVEQDSPDVSAPDSG